MHVIALEPSRPLLEKTAGALRERGVPFEAVSATIQVAAHWLAHVLQRYRPGLIEYAAEPLVVQGSSRPVMFGYFDPIMPVPADPGWRRPRSIAPVWH